MAGKGSQSHFCGGGTDLQTTYTYFPALLKASRNTEMQMAMTMVKYASQCLNIILYLKEPGLEAMVDTLTRTRIKSVRRRPKGLCI